MQHCAIVHDEHHFCRIAFKSQGTGVIFYLSTGMLPDRLSQKHYGGDLVACLQSSTGLWDNKRIWSPNFSCYFPMLRCYCLEKYDNYMETFLLLARPRQYWSCGPNETDEVLSEEGLTTGNYQSPVISWWSSPLPRPKHHHILPVWIVNFDPYHVISVVLCI